MDLHRFGCGPGMPASGSGIDADGIFLAGREDQWGLEPAT